MSNPEFPPAPYAVNSAQFPPSPFGVSSAQFAESDGTSSTEESEEERQKEAAARAPLVSAEHQSSAPRSPISTGLASTHQGIFERLHQQFKDENIYGYERAKSEYKNFVQKEAKEGNVTEFQCDRNKNDTPKITKENGKEYLTYRLDGDIIKYEVDKDLKVLSVDASGVKKHNVITAPITHQEFGYECRYYEKDSLKKSFSSSERQITEIVGHIKPFAKRVQEGRDNPRSTELG